MEGRENRETSGRWSGQRALSTASAAVIMIVVILIVGAGGYFAFNAAGPKSSTSTHCAPASSPTCLALLPTHDIQLIVPFKAVQAGTPVPFSFVLPSGESASQFNINFGDGHNQSVTGSSATWQYKNPGIYIVSVTGTVSGVTHDNYHGLVQIAVSSAYSASAAGSQPGVTGSVVSNTSTTTGGATAVLSPGNSVTLSGSYSSAPTNPLFSLQPPTMAFPSGVTPTTTATNNSATSSATFASSGVYVVTFVGSAVSGAVHAFQNFTWTVFVAPTGLNAGLASTGAAGRSQHPGSIVTYEFVPGGGSSEDPAIDYETAGYEPILNVYQTLITYNGTQSGPGATNYVPQLAACVPGSVQCTRIFGNTLSDGTNFTFVLPSSAQFYDPNNANSATNHWGVYPTDVLFSLARTMGFATLPSFGGNNGWIVTQAIVGPATGTWSCAPGAPCANGLVTGPANVTPQHIFGQVLVNSTAGLPASVACPAIATTDARFHGCVTIQANAGGQNWPFFLELIADALGSAVVPCGWFSAGPQSAGIPGWTYGPGETMNQGDHPCLLPGNVTTSDSPTFKSHVAAMPDTSWDAWETAGSSPPFWGNVRYAMSGSGPYYMQNYQVATSYALKANPDYVQNPFCTWAGCQPAANSYAKSVQVTWETSALPGEQAYASGVADFATIPVPDTALLLQLIQQGKVGATSFPSISIYFFPFNLNFSASGISRYTTNPVTLPSDAYSYVALRQFVTHAFPYTTAENTISTKDGIQFLFNYGGAIPQFMGNYYPTNISWPSGDPISATTTPGSAGWWWHQAVTPGSNFYDPELAGCSAAAPCQLPIFGENGAPDVDQRMALWSSWVKQISGGAFQMYPVDINFVDLVINSLYSPPGANPMPFYTLGWAPDYPDPTDYMTPMYKPDSTYTLSDTVNENLQGVAKFNDTTNSTCTAHYHNIGFWASVVTTGYGIPEKCQGAAYASMAYAMAVAAHMPDGPARVLMYNMIEQVANGLALYQYFGQSNEVFSYASYINPASLNANITIGGGGDFTWYSTTGNGISG